MNLAFEMKHIILDNKVALIIIPQGHQVKVVLNLETEK